MCLRNARGDVRRPRGSEADRSRLSSKHKAGSLAKQPRLAVEAPGVFTTGPDLTEMLTGPLQPLP